MSKFNPPNLNIERVVLWTSIIFFIAIILCNAFGCVECQKLSQRCNKEYLQLCDTRGQWRTVVDCKHVYTIKGTKTCKCVCNVKGQCSCEGQQ